MFTNLKVEKGVRYVTAGRNFQAITLKDENSGELVVIWSLQTVRDIADYLEKNDIAYIIRHSHGAIDYKCMNDSQLEKVRRKLKRAGAKKPK